MNNMPAFFQLASMSFKCIFFVNFFMITDKIPLNVIARKFTISCMPTHLSYWYHEYVYINTIHLYWSTFYVKGSLYTWHFLNKCRFMIWHILISESVSVYGRYVVGLLSVWVRDCWSTVGYDSSIVLTIGFQSVSCRLSIGLKSGDSIPNLTRNDPDMNPTGFTVDSATLSVAESLPIHWIYCGFYQFRVGLAGVTGVRWKSFYLMTS